jgi:RHS repeat-associated protein
LTTGTIPGVSFEFKYSTTGNAAKLKRILAGAFRAEPTLQMPKLATFEYDGSGRLLYVLDGRSDMVSGLLARRFEFEWAGTQAWQVTKVLEPVDSGAGAAMAVVESFTWVSGMVDVHRSRGLHLDHSASATVNNVTTVQWSRNGATESSSFDAPSGKMLTCGSGSCGLGGRAYAASADFGTTIPAGLAFVQTEEGYDRHRVYDQLDRLIFECDVDRSTASVESVCGLVDEGATEQVLLSDGVVRRAVRHYYVGDTGVVRATAEWNNAAPGAPVFPSASSTQVNWFGTASAPLTTCPVLHTEVVADGVTHSYRVTVFDHDSDGDGSLNEFVAATVWDGDFAVTRTTTMGSVDGSQRAGTCTVAGIDAHGRPDRSAEETRFHFNGTGWTAVESVVRGYKNLTTTTLPRRAGLPSSYRVQRTPLSTSSADRITFWQECATTTPTLYDEEGRLICFDVPHGTDFLRVTETTVADAGARRRTYVFADQGGATLLSTFRRETANGKVLDEGVVGGNSTRTRYSAAGDARFGALPTIISEILSNGSTFRTTALVYDTSTTSGGFLIKSNTSGTGMVTTERRWGGHDADGRPSTVADENGANDATTQLSYTAFDALASVVEPDGQREEYAYDDGLRTEIRRAATPAGTASRFGGRAYDRRGNLKSFRGGNASTVTSEVTRDGLDRVVFEELVAADILRRTTYSDVGRVSLSLVQPRFANTPTRAEATIYDGLGRRLQTCNATPTGTCISGGESFTFVYDTKGPFAGIACATEANGVSLSLTNRFLQGRLGYVSDGEGGTAYEYDAIGRVTAVARHDGPLSNFSPANVTCTGYAYTAQGAIQTIRYPSSRLVTYDYGVDKARPTGVRVSMGASTVTVANTVAYESNGAVRSLRWGGGATNLRLVTRDGLLRPGEITDTISGTNRSRLTYAYDLDGNLDSETDHVAPTALNTSVSLAPVTRSYATDIQRDILTYDAGVSYTYDIEGRVVGPTYSGNAREFATNEFGTLFGRNLFGEVETIDLAPSGSVDRRLTHGLFGQLSQFEISGGVWNYDYDHELRRVRKRPPASDDPSYRARFRYGLGRAILEDFLRTNATSFSRAEWIYLGDTPIGVIRATAAGGTGTLFYVFSDRMGVPRKLATTSGTVSARIVMDAFGVGQTAYDATSPRLDTRYAGQHRDGESGYVNNGWRTKISATRYSSPDPLHADTQSSHLGAGVYTYAANRPQVFQDPDGRQIPATTCNGPGGTIRPECLGDDVVTGPQLPVPGYQPPLAPPPAPAPFPWAWCLSHPLACISGGAGAAAATKAVVDKQTCSPPKAPRYCEGISPGSNIFERQVCSFKCSPTEYFECELTVPQKGCPRIADINGAGIRCREVER